MSLADESSLLFIPTGYKESKIYSVFPTTGVGDFTFNRNSSATRIAKNGLITSVATDIPRLDYPLIDGVVNGCPSLLLEPQRTNAAPYSEAFDNSFWIKADATVVGGFSAPDGSNNAFKLIEGTSNSQHNVRSDFIATTNGSEIASSIFVKADTRSEVSLQEIAYTVVYLTVDLISETITTNGTSANLTKLDNGWFRIDIVSTCNIVTAWRVSPSLNGTSTYQGDGTSGIYIWGFQLEDVASYATSYIPTEGSAVTRLADTASGSGNSEVFNDSEGVLFAEMSVLANDLSIEGVSINNVSASNRVVIFKWNTSNTIRARVTSNSVNTFDFDVVVSDITNFNKIALKYKENDFALWINGIEVATDSIGATPIGLSELGFDSDGLGGASSYGKTKELAYYNTALTDLELETLTSYRSWLSMANGQQYSIK